LEELEDEFLRIEDIADELYRARVPDGTSVSLSRAIDESGEPFVGIDDDRLWLVGLVCEGCYNPAPWFLSRLTPCIADE
jgi:hypothetical protein